MALLKAISLKKPNLQGVLGCLDVLRFTDVPVFCGGYPEIPQFVRSSTCANAARTTLMINDFAPK